MNSLTKLSLVLSTTVLSACVNQHTVSQQQLKPVTNPCAKITALINAYDTGFEQIKITQIKGKSSNTWKAKYNLVGDNCHIWSWGNDNVTYACNFSANDEKTAETYYQKSISTTKQCLDEHWISKEEPRKKDNGKKTTFTNPESPVSISSHLVPLDSVFSDRWTVYYYVGNPKQ